MKKVDSLRKKYPRFVYQKYYYRLKRGDLMVSFCFKIEPDIVFKPKIVIKNISEAILKKIGDKELNNLIFHLGLIEIPTYWKTTCSPEIVIRAGRLDKAQVRWWHDLIIDGMGQFFYENRIDYRNPAFLKVSSNPGIYAPPLTESTLELKERHLVPFSGGKDSIVTLEKLKKQEKETALFSVNPTNQILKTAKISGVKKHIIAERKIDKKLLVLNAKGYLNGHTPFTAFLSFLSVLCAALFDYKNIAFSNEKSANEGNVKYLGRIINHQWSKSSEFEKRFKSYSKKYLIKGVNCFSFLRKYSEFQITRLFTNYPKYFLVFSSCNTGMKISPSTKKRWCCKCPKCLFVYLTLYPFLEKKQILKIFNKDLFDDKKLMPILMALLGKGKHKPFECVGTYKESLLAYKLSLKKAKKANKIPYLLKNACK